MRLVSVYWRSWVVRHTFGVRQVISPNRVLRAEHSASLLFVIGKTAFYRTAG